MVAAALSTIFLWLAESVGTATGTWVYAGQADFTLAPLAKAGSWHLLLYVSFVQVALVYRDRVGNAQETADEHSIPTHHGPRP